MSEDNKFNKYVCGVSLISSRDANFNADFTGYPRKLPEDRTFFATDKALKYSVRKYMRDFYSSEDSSGVLMWREFKKEGEGNKLEYKPKSLEEKHKDIIGKSENKEELVKTVFNKFIDVRLFGVTYTPKTGKTGTNFSLTGPFQVSYGIDKFGKGSEHLVQITSPKPTKEGDNQFTIGSEVRLTEAHYSYDFVFNPNNIENDSFLENIDYGNLHIRQNDIEVLKEGLLSGVTYLNSCTKKGAENSLLVWAEFSKDEKQLVPRVSNLKDLVNVDIDSEDDEKRTVDLSKVMEELLKHREYLDKLEIYYDKTKLSLRGVDEVSDNKINIKDILD